MPGLQELGLDQAGAWRGWRLMLFALLLAFVLSLAGVGLLRQRLLVARMLDAPGQRRLHSTPIPRGGGLALVFAAIVAMGAASWMTVSGPELLPLIAGLLLVAAIGWQD